MNPGVFALGACLAPILFVAACQRKASAAADSTGPVPATVQPAFNANDFSVAQPERFSIATAGEHSAAPQLNVTGVVNPDVSRQVPVPSLASGRVVEIDTRLGDQVAKGQLLFKVRSADISGAFSDYQQAVKNEALTKIQLERAKRLLDIGAIPQSGLEIAQTAEDVNLVVVHAAEEHLKVLGVDPDHPSAIVEVFAPVSGVITDQQITDQSGVQALTPPNPFTISDISQVWIICDVYENDLAQVHLLEFADIHIDAYPGRVLKARIANIFPVLDPSIRTAKVRLEVENPVAAGGSNQRMLKLGMFVTATFHGLAAQTYATVPATAILYLHDREWVYAALGNDHFRRQGIIAGDMLPGGLQEVVSGLKPGDRVVAGALDLENSLGP
ncbi:MAG TPA: efflux RND transporter periplasmic adaptor subunit [Bryobacteraceae bacterium]